MIKIYPLHREKTMEEERLQHKTNGKGAHRELTQIRTRVIPNGIPTAHTMLDGEINTTVGKVHGRTTGQAMLESLLGKVQTKMEKS